MIAKWRETTSNTQRARTTVDINMITAARTRQGRFMDKSIAPYAAKLTAMKIKEKTAPSDGRSPPTMPIREMSAKALVIFIFSAAITARPPTSRQDVITVITGPARADTENAAPITCITLKAIPVVTMRRPISASFFLLLRAIASSDRIYRVIIPQKNLGVNIDKAKGEKYNFNIVRKT